MINSLGKKYHGQSLMESIIAIGLIMSVVVSSISISIYTTRLGRSSQNNLVAYNLAREGIEYVRNIRDSNWLAGAAWDNGFSACLLDDWCKISFEYDTVNSIWAWNESALLPGESEISNCLSCQLLIDSTNDLYSLKAGGKASGFYRALKIDTSTPDILKVTVKVLWLENNRSKTITLEEDLTNWRYE